MIRLAIFVALAALLTLTPALSCSVDARKREGDGVASRD